jgi:integrase
MKQPWNGKLLPGVRERRLVDGTYVFDVQDGTGHEQIRATFAQWTTANAYKAACKDIRRGGRPEERPTREAWLALRAEAASSASECAATVALLDALDRCAAPIKARHRRKGPVSHRLGVLKRFLAAQQLAGEPSMDDVTPEIGELLGPWLSAEHYSYRTAQAVVSFARRLWNAGMRYGLAGASTGNPFAEAKAMQPAGGTDRRGRRPDTSRMRAWTWQELAAISRLLHAAYRFPFWLAVLTGMRLSEVMGLEIGEWDVKARVFNVTGQRCGSPKQGKDEGKTPSAHRNVPVARLLAWAVDRYIRLHHGPRPADPIRGAEWASRYLVVGRKRLAALGGSPGPMNPESFAHALKTAYEQLGLTATALGFSFRPTHILRYFFVTELITQKGSPISGPAGAVLIGHRSPLVTAETAGATSTTRAYQILSDGDLECAVRHIDSVIEREIVAGLGITQLLDPHECAETMAIADAARALGIGCDDVLELVRRGELVAETSSPYRGTSFVVHADGVWHLARAQARDTTDTLDATSAARVLAVPRERLYQLAEHGEIEEVTERASARVARRGGSGGNLPGGGRRFTKASVNALAETWSDRIERIAGRTPWLSMSEASARTGWSVDTIRRLADDGTLTSWRDDLPPHPRYVEPNSLRRLNGTAARYTIHEAAVRARVSDATVRAAIKLGDVPFRECYARSGARRPVVAEVDIRTLAAMRTGANESDAAGVA